METLTLRDRELVALGAALAAGCIPCIEYHVPRAREAGLSDPEITEAIDLADKIRRVPATKVLAAATRAVGAPAKALKDTGEPLDVGDSGTTSCC